MEIDGKAGREIELIQLAYEMEINYTAFIHWFFHFCTKLFKRVSGKIGCGTRNKGYRCFKTSIA